MKASELMIGDLVWYVDKPIKVEQNYGKSVRYSDGEYTHEIEQSYITPIPLTEEMFDANDLQLPETILEKNGDDPVEWNTLSFMYYRIDLEELQTEVWEVDIKHNQRSLLDGACTKIKFRYVHELQHALRLCGLSELADNFKVE